MTQTDPAFRPPLRREPAAPDPVREEGTPQGDPALRPRSLDAFIGQLQVTRNLRVALESARMRGEALDHILFSGPPGLGKTTLAGLIAREQGVGFTATSGPVLDRPADLAGILTSLGRGDVLFIDEIHRLPTQVEEYLYSAMEDFRLVILIDQGPRSRTVPVDLEPFTLVGATTREGLLSPPFRARFGIHERLDPYGDDDLVLVAQRSAGLLDISLEPGAAALIARRARGTPRLVNRFLRRIRDLAVVAAETRVTEALASEALERLGLDSSGLLPMDRAILDTLRKAAPHAVGLKTLGVTVGEEERTIEAVYEPFLIREGYLARTPRGRMLTPLGWKLLGAAPPPGYQGNLYEG